MPIKSNKAINSEMKNNGVYVLIRRTYHDVKIISAFTTKRDADVEKNRLDKEFKGEGKKRVFDYFEIHKAPLIFNSRAKKKK